MSRRAADIAWALWALTSATCAQRDLTQWPTDPLAAISSMAASTGTATGELITVTDADGQPVAGADLYTVPRDPVDAATTFFLDSHFGVDPWPVIGAKGLLAQRYGKRYRTNAEGQVRVEAHARTVGIAIAGANASRWTSMRRGAKLALAPFRTVRVEVVDSDGIPAAHVPVTFGYDPYHAYAGGITGADGRARLRVKASRVMITRTAFVQVGVLAMPPLRLELAADYFDAERPALLRLQLPPTGTVRVRVTDGEVHGISLRPKEPAGALGLDARAWPPTRWEGNEAVFPLVTPGIELDGGVHLVGVSGSEFEFVAASPKASGEQSTTTYSVADSVFDLRGRLLDPAGRPVANTQLWLWETGARGRGLDQPRTDADGRFRHVLDATRRQGDIRRIEIRLADHEKATAPLPAAVIVLPTDKRGRVELGDQQLAIEPPVLSGRVVDTDGQPVAGLKLGVPLTMWAALQVPSPSSWAVTDAEGRFVLREAEAEATDLPLRIQGAEWALVEPASAPTGADDLVVQVHRLGAIHLTLADPAGTDLLLVQTVPVGAPGRRSRTVRARRGKASISGLAVGQYDVVITLSGREVQRIAGVEARPEPGALNRRLENVIWSAKITRSRVRMVAQDGTPLRGRFYIADVTQTASPATILADANGEATVPHLEGQTVIATDDSHRHTTVELDGEGVREVRLAPRPRLRLRLPDGLTLPAGVRIRCENEWSGQRLPTPRFTWPGGAEFVIEPVATHSLTLRFELWGRRVVTLLDQVVDLPDDDTLTDVALSIDEETAAAAKEFFEHQAKSRR